MKNTVTLKKLEAEKKRIDKEIELFQITQGFEKDDCIVEVDFIFYDMAIAQVVVSYHGMYSLLPEMADKFIKVMQFATEHAKSFKYNNYYIADWNT